MTTAGIDVTGDPWRVVVADRKGEIMGSYKIRIGARPDAEISSDLSSFLLRFGKRIPVVLGIGGRGVTLKHIVLPRLEGADLMGAATSELMATVTFPEENAVIDCSIMERIEQDGIGKIRVLGVLAEKKPVVEIIERIHRGGGEVIAVEPTAFSILRYSERMDLPDAGRFWIHIRPDSLSVAALANGSIIFWREVLRDFSLLAETGMRAEMAREGTVSEAVQSLDYFSTKHHQIEISQVMLISSLKDKASLKLQLAQGLGIDVVSEDPFERLAASPNERPEGDNVGPEAYLVATGLALRSER